MPARLDPALFGEGQARDGRFLVVECWAECANFPDGHPEKQIEFLHRQMNEELNVLENAARNLAEFPDADWTVRYWLARQCADEARHALAYRHLVERRGARIGQYPVMNFQYRILGRISTLEGRLAVQNRTFEADGLDAAVFGLEAARDSGEDDLVRLYDAQQGDEVVHVRFANEFIARRASEDPRCLMAVAKALRQAGVAFQQIFADGGTSVSKYGVAEEARLEAGFGPEEVAEAVRLNEERRASVRASMSSSA